MAPPSLQGGEEAAALLSQLDATEGGEIEMNWNIKVCGFTAHPLSCSSCISYTSGSLSVKILTLLDSCCQGRSSPVGSKQQHVTVCAALHVNWTPTARHASPGHSLDCRSFCRHWCSRHSRCWCLHSCCIRGVGWWHPPPPTPPRAPRCSQPPPSWPTLL